jgi:hypothetical protein
MVLILEYAGGEGNCVVKMQGRAPLRMPFPCCFMEPRPRTVDLLRECFRGTIQFVVVKPGIGMISIIMVSQDLYFNPIYQTIMLTIYNISYTVALYYLLVFYLATKEACANYYPVSKFAAVKGIVFATYYQSMLIRCMGMSTKLAESWGDFILCVEMIFFALMLGCAFPKEPYDIGPSLDGGGSVGRVIASASNVMTVQDLVADAYHNFMPAYQDYLLQREDTTSFAKVKRRKFKLPGTKSAIAGDNQLLLTGLCWGVDTCMQLEMRGEEVVGNGLNKHGYFVVTGRLVVQSEEGKKEDSDNYNNDDDVNRCEEDSMERGGRAPSSSSSSSSPSQHTRDPNHPSRARLELRVTNDHGTVPLVLKSFERRGMSPLEALRRLNKKSAQNSSNSEQQQQQPQSVWKNEKYPISWRGVTEEGKEAVFDDMTVSLQIYNIFKTYFELIFDYDTLYRFSSCMS